ncbi:MAG TPA: YbhB/YbcL family Raf kinase inhibitor-like protein [Amycolatopsis sp.]|nr:YbhB/YbcL family Raf kinase inhibitor-like protein [Amycolatopsis sp.]
MKVRLGDLTITSPAFEHGGRIPDRHTRLGEASSPPLHWSAPPAGTQSFALICDDPDAPLHYGFTHWVVYNIPGNVTALEEGEDQKYTTGRHGFGEQGYFPPGPPPGHGTHFYFFHLYALDAQLDLEPALDRATVLRRIDDHVIQQARIVGTFSQP